MICKDTVFEELIKNANAYALCCWWWQFPYQLPVYKSHSSHLLFLLIWWHKKAGDGSWQVIKATLSLKSNVAVVTLCYSTIWKKSITDQWTILCTQGVKTTYLFLVKLKSYLQFEFTYIYMAVLLIIVH